MDKNMYIGQFSNGFPFLFGSLLPVGQGREKISPSLASGGELLDFGKGCLYRK
jgi:hypothetical protein